MCVYLCRTQNIFTVRPSQLKLNLKFRRLDTFIFVVVFLIKVLELIYFVSCFVQLYLLFCNNSFPSFLHVIGTK